MRFSVRNSALKAASRLGLKSSSEPHTSSCNFRHDSSSTPIVLLGFARTGTTTAQTLLARSLGYNQSFEPFAAQAGSGTGLPDANYWFRGSPPHDALPDLRRTTGCAIAPQWVTDPLWKEELQTALCSQIQAIHSRFGWNCLWKEIRLVPTLPAIRKTYDSLGKRVLFIGLRGNPLGLLYAYYRLLALGPKPGLHWNHSGTLLEYRKSAYEELSLLPDLASLKVSAPAHELILAALLDQAFLELQSRQFPDSVILTELSDLDAASKAASRFCHVPATPIPSRIQSVPKWARDPWFRRLVVDKIPAQIQEALWNQWGPPPLPDKHGSGRAWWTHALNRVAGGL